MEGGRQPWGEVGAALGSAVRATEGDPHNLGPKQGRAWAVGPELLAGTARLRGDTRILQTAF